MRVLVCGGRDYGEVPKGCPPDPKHESRIRAAKERSLLFETLDTMYVDRHIEAIIHGAQTGADSLAGAWARSRLIYEMPFKANWYPNGRKGGLDRSAGPRRNQAMIDEGEPDLVDHGGGLAKGRAVAKEAREATRACGRLAQRLEPAAHNGLTLVRLQHRLPQNKSSLRPYPLRQRRRLKLSATGSRRGLGMKSEWQPIETAPADGVPVLIYQKAHGLNTVAIDDPGIAVAVRRPQSTFEWWGVCGSGIGIIHPTHWMPLPEPPNEATSTPRSTPSR